MHYIFGIVLIFLAILYFISKQGKKYLFDEGKVKPKWLKFFIFPYLSILLMIIFALICYFFDNKGILLKYFLEMGVPYKNIENVELWIKVFSNVTSFVFSLSNFYILVALFVYFLIKCDIKWLLITLIYFLTYPFAWFLVIKLLVNNIDIPDAEKLINLHDVIKNKMLYIGDMLDNPILNYSLFISILAFLFLSNRNS